MNPPFTDLDHDFLEHIGGVQNNSFINVLDSDINENADLIQPQIINHSPYYDFEKLSVTLISYKNKFSICSTNIQSINAKIDELRIFIEWSKKNQLYI